MARMRKLAETKQSFDRAEFLSCRHSNANLDIVN